MPYYRCPRCGRITSHTAIRFLTEARDRRVEEISEFAATSAEFDRAREVGDREFYAAARRLAAAHDEVR